MVYTIKKYRFFLCKKFFTSKTIVYTGQKTQGSEGRIQQGSSQYIVFTGGSRQFRQGGRGRGPDVFVSFVINVFHKEPYEPPSSISK